MIIMKIKKGFYLCKGVDGIHYAIVQSHENKACYTRCCFADECKKFKHPKKPLIKYLGIEKTCGYFFRDAAFPLEDGNLFYFKRFKGGM